MLNIMKKLLSILFIPLLIVCNKVKERPIENKEPEIIKSIEELKKEQIKITIINKAPVKTMKPVEPNKNEVTVVK